MDEQVCDLILIQRNSYKSDVFKSNCATVCRCFLLQTNNQQNIPKICLDQCPKPKQDRTARTFIENSNTLLCLCVPATLVSLRSHDATLPHYIRSDYNIL